MGRLWLRTGGGASCSWARPQPHRARRQRIRYRATPERASDLLSTACPSPHRGGRSSFRSGNGSKFLGFIVDLSPIAARTTPTAFTFCDVCGSRLGEQPAPPQEARKTVTVVFCDLVDSTVLGGSTQSRSARSWTATRGNKEILERTAASSRNTSAMIMAPSDFRTPMRKTPSERCERRRRSTPSLEALNLEFYREQKAKPNGDTMSEVPSHESVSPPQGHWAI